MFHLNETCYLDEHLRRSLPAMQSRSVANETFMRDCITINKLSKLLCAKCELVKRARKLKRHDKHELNR